METVDHRGDRSTKRRAPFTAAERWSLVAAAAGMFVLGTYGFARHEPSTLAYLFSVIVVAIVIGLVRRESLPPWLAVALAGLAIGHLAGGLVTVGGDVLYNAHAHLRVVQYDHIFHATASGVATVILSIVLSREISSVAVRISVAVLGGLGVGAINELIEFLATLAHHGAHVGGYRNTGWDLLSNTVGAAVAATGLALTAQERSRP